MLLAQVLRSNPSALQVGMRGCRTCRCPKNSAIPAAALTPWLPLSSSPSMLAAKPWHSQVRIHAPARRVNHCLQTVQHVTPDAVDFVTQTVRCAAGCALPRGSVAVLVGCCNNTSMLLRF